MGVCSGLACFIPGYNLVGDYTLGCYTGIEIAVKSQNKIFVYKLKIRLLSHVLRRITVTKYKHQKINSNLTQIYGLLNCVTIRLGTP